MKLLRTFIVLAYYIHEKQKCQTYVGNISVQKVKQ